MSQDLVWAIGLILLAAVLLLLELSLPTGGLLGIGGVIALGGGLFLAFSDGLVTGMISTVAVVLMFPALAAVAIRVWPHTPIGRRILNLPPGDADESASLFVDPRHEQLRMLVGRVGVTKTDLLPSGLIEVDRQRFDVVAQGAAIDRGEFVEVISVQAGKIRVRATDRRPEEQATAKSGALISGDAEAADADRTPDLDQTTLAELDLEDLGDPLS